MRVCKIRRGLPIVILVMFGDVVPHGRMLIFALLYLLKCITRKRTELNTNIRKQSYILEPQMNNK